MTTFADATWTALEHDNSTTVIRAFDPATLDDLPEPAQRLLHAALPPQTPLCRSVCLSMRGEIKLAGRWFAFTARQLLRANTGFVWKPVVGGRLLRFVGADALGPDGAQIEFRLHGLIPIVRGSSSDIAKSATGRLAAETVAWLPHALTPQAGARWSGVDERRATVTLQGPGGPTDVEVEVNENGRLTALGLQRWKDSAKPPRLAPFGGMVDTCLTTVQGVTIAAVGSVGWDWHSAGEANATFFRFEITGADFDA